MKDKKEQIRSASRNILKHTIKTTGIKKDRKYLINIGLCDVILDGNFLKIEYRGNMGSGMREVNAKLSTLSLPAIEELKDMFDVVKEKGHPEYLYNITFKL